MKQIYVQDVFDTVIYWCDITGSEALASQCTFLKTTGIAYKQG